MTFATALNWSLFVCAFSGGHIKRAFALVQHPQGRSVPTRLSFAQREVALQLDTNASMSTETHPFAYTSRVKMRPALDYFMGWHQDEVEFHTSMAKKVSAHFGKGVSMLDSDAHISTNHALSILARHRAHYCPQWRETHTNSDLISHLIDESGVQHMLLASRLGGFQYVAALSGRLLAADPSACPELPVSVLQSDPTVDTSSVSSTQTGVPQNLALDHPLVQQCEGVYHAKMLEQCSADETLTVSAAKEKLISDGYAIEMTSQIGSKQHTVECDFNFTQASDGSGHHVSDVTLRMAVDICAAGSTGDTAVTFARMGDTSRTKGLDWKVKLFPKVATSDLHVALGATANRDEVDIRTDVPECFPDHGRAVVRDQGLCANCWAHAAASVAMTMICKSNTQEAMAGTNQRFEISVQQLMRCNAAEAGCNGGGADQVTSAFRTGGIVKESVVPYECAGGNAVDHFSQESDIKCQSFPWGDGQCDPSKAESTWFFGQYGAMYRTKGHDDLKLFLAAGYPLSMTYDVYYNFVHDLWTIYNVSSGDFLGPHAVAGLGYGSEGGMDYWLIQNSWGPNAPNSVNGYQKIKRGINLCDIETEAYYIRTWAEPGYRPPCFDSELGTLVPDPASTDGGIIPCTQAKSGNYYGINLCTYADTSISDVVKSQCPIACEVDACDITTPAPTTPTTTQAPTTTPAPATTTAAVAAATSKKTRRSKKSGKDGKSKRTRRTKRRRNR